VVPADRGNYQVIVSAANGGKTESVFQVIVAPIVFDKTTVVGWGIFDAYTPATAPTDLVDVVAVAGEGNHPVITV